MKLNAAGINTVLELQNADPGTTIAGVSRTRLKVFVDNLAVPVLTVPINIAAFMDLDNGRAWIGFTASTGRSMQNHDVSSFTFREQVVGLEAVA